MERTRLLRQVQDRLGQLEQTYLEATDKAWGTFGREGRRITGYTYNNVRLEPLTAMPGAAEAALQQGRTITSPALTREAGGVQSASIPIKLRGRVLGVVHVNLRGGAPERTVALIEQAADRLGAALENVRLLDDSMRRANKERTIGEISAKISSSINMRNVLQTAVEELGRAIPGSEVSIRLRGETPDSAQEVPA
jgi:GAF domain-containing protein